MIQRVQSLFLLSSAIFSLIIVYSLPVLEDENTAYFLAENFPYVRLCILLSVALSIFAIFQFRTRRRQHLITSFSRLMITIAFFLVIFLHSQDKSFGLGMILLVVPFLSLIGANFFINRDEKLVSSADRLR